MMDSESKVQVPKLSSTNYRSWSGMMRLVLAGKRLVKYIDTDVKDLIEEKTRKLTESTIKASPPPDETPKEGSSTSSTTTTATGKALEQDGALTKAIEDATETLLLGDD